LETTKSENNIENGKSFQDPTLIILVIAGFVNLALSFYEPEQEVDSGDEDNSPSASAANLTATIASIFVSNLTGMQ